VRFLDVEAAGDGTADVVADLAVAVELGELMGSSSRVTQPTPTIVTAVAPKASPMIGTAFSRLSRGADRNAA
jgi:hypothetical protein